MLPICTLLSVWLLLFWSLLFFAFLLFFLAGVVSDAYRRKRAAVLLCTMCGMFAGHLTMALAPRQLLLATVIIGFMFGGIFGTAPVFVAEEFGKPHFGTNWGTAVVAPAIGSLS